MTHPLQSFRDSKPLLIHQSEDSHFNEKLYTFGREHQFARMKRDMNNRLVKNWCCIEKSSN